MEKFPMKRWIKYALGYSFSGERDDKSDRKHLEKKTKKRGMRNYIKRDANREIKEALESDSE